MAKSACTGGSHLIWIKTETNKTQWKKVWIVWISKKACRVTQQCGFENFRQTSISNLTCSDKAWLTCTIRWMRHWPICVVSFQAKVQLRGGTDWTPPSKSCWKAKTLSRARLACCAHLPHRAWCDLEPARAKSIKWERAGLRTSLKWY